jgi:predicted alpha/beta hydrolase family esterase
MEKGPSAHRRRAFFIVMIVDVVRAESSRFHHPLLMVHGLWTGGWIWQRFAAYLAHRGWDVWTPSLLDDPSRADWEVRRQGLLELSRTLPAAPILIGHDAGVALIASIGVEITAPASVAIAPVMPAFGAALLAQPRFWLARLWAKTVAPPAGPGARAFGGDLESADVARLRPDSGAYFRALHDQGIVGAQPAQPGLMIVSTNDDFSAVAPAHRLAQRWGWSFDLHETPGHFPMLTVGSEALADRVHRWLVHAMGTQLLAWIDDEEEGE